jgi:hypothetical protein
MVRLGLALVAAAAIILSAPVVQQAFTAISRMFPSIGLAATALPIAVAVAIAAARIRDRRRLRLAALVLSLAIGGAYVLVDALTPAESFHFVEYGLLAFLFYRAVDRGAGARADGSLLILPLLAGIATGVLDEWFQWFVPIRAGELRDIVLDAVASICGVLFAVSIRPPARLTLELADESRSRVRGCTAATVALAAAFAVTVHVAREVRDPDVGTFVSRYSAAQLAAFASDRAERWRTRPPLAVRRFSREDQYLSEGLWHVQRRNEAWERSDIGAAWRENLILEKFFAPVLDARTYASEAPQRWPPEQRAEAASRPGVDRRPAASAEYRWPVYVMTP